MGFSRDSSLEPVQVEPGRARRLETPLLKPGVRPGFQPKHTKKKDQPNGWSFKKIAPSTHFIRAQRGNEDSGLRAADGALFFILVDFRRSENQKGDFARCDGRLRALP